jgi:hypothetical protein
MHRPGTVKMLRILFHIMLRKANASRERILSLVFFQRKFLEPTFFGEEFSGGEADYLPGKGGSKE